MATAFPGLIKQLKVTGPLPRLAPHAERFAAFELTLDREVELRLAPAEAPEAPRARAFRQEVEELSALDHPSFLPVLGTGAVAERAYYTVPRREHPTLAELTRDPGVGLEERTRALESLARALAHLHGKGIVLGALDPGLVAWDRARGVAWFLHHRPVEDPEATSRIPFMPAALMVGAAGSPRLDVAFWGALAFGLLSGGKAPFGPGRDEPQALGPLAAGLEPAWVRLVEGCFAPGGHAPVDGAALVKRLEAPPAPAPPGPSAPASAPTTPPAAAPAPREDSGAALSRQAPTRKVAVESVRGDSSPRMAAAPARPSEPVPATPGSPVPNTAPGPGGGGIPPLAVVGFALLVGVGAFMAVGGREGGEDRPPARPTPGPAGEVPTSSPAAPSGPRPVASPRVDDPYLAILLRQPPVEPRDFMRIYAIVAHLARSGRLPGDLNDNEAVAAIRARFEESPSAACKDLNAMLEKIRAAALQKGEG